MDWFIRHFIVQKAIRYDNPGVVITKFKTSSGEVFQREVFFPESLIIDLEKEIVKKFGEKGKQVLYDIGKTIGYNFAYIFKAPSLKMNTIDEVEKFIEFVIKYIFATWAENITINELDIQNFKLNIQVDQHIVCRTDGLGLIFTEGAEAGFASYVFSNEEVEVVQIECQGRGDNVCVIQWGLKKFFDEQNINFFKGNIFFKIKNDIRDRIFNDYSKKISSNESMYSLIKKGIFQYKEGKITYLNERYFDSGIITYYLIEYGLKQLKAVDEVIYNIGFEFGKKIAMNKEKSYILNIFSALGWGDINLLYGRGKDFVIINYFPWCVIESKLDKFPLIMGLISGSLSSLKNKEIHLRQMEKIINTQQKKFSIKIY